MTHPALAGLAARFIEGARADAATMEQAVAAGDMATIERLAHSVAGAAGIFGLTEIGAAALAIDDRFAAGETPDRSQVETLIGLIRAHS